MADGLSVILFEASKSVQKQFHSQMRNILKPLLQVLSTCVSLMHGCSCGGMLNRATHERA
eukprot:3840061-Amphidinium_carterae.3